MPRIAVDATTLTARPTGAGRVLRSLLATLPAVDPETDYVALATPEGAAVLREAAPAVDVHEVDVGTGLAWELHGVALAAVAAEADLLFTTRELIWRATPPTVLHVFEPPHYRLRVPSDRRRLRSTVKDALLAAAFAGTARRAAAVTAGSETTAAWLARRGVAASVMLPGLDERFFAPGEAVTRSEPYLFHVASDDPRDLTGAIFESLSLLAKDAPLLVVVGVSSRRRNELERCARAAGVHSRVEFLGWVSDAELRANYRGAYAAVQPSRYEAYGGLPSLEAMALGTPVVAARAPGVTEALEGAALLVESAEPQQLAAAIRRVMTDAGLRAELAAEGRRRVAPLHWDRAATQLAAVFHRTLATKVR